MLAVHGLYSLPLKHSGRTCMHRAALNHAPELHRNCTRSAMGPAVRLPVAGALDTAMSGCIHIGARLE